MPIEIPLRNDLDAWRQTTAIDGVPYQWRLRWNVRAQGWVLSILTGGGETLVAGLFLVLRWDLLRAHRAREPRLPEGLLVAVALDGTTTPPSRTDLGERVRLYWYSEAEVSDLRTDASPVVVTAAPVLFGL